MTWYMLTGRSEKDIITSQIWSTVILPYTSNLGFFDCPHVKSRRVDRKRQRPGKTSSKGPQVGVRLRLLRLALQHHLLTLWAKLAPSCRNLDLQMCHNLQWWKLHSWPHRSEHKKSANLRVQICVRQRTGVVLVSEAQTAKYWLVVLFFLTFCF